MSKVKFVDIQKVLDNQDLTKIDEMIEFIENLKRKRVFTIEQQAKLVKSIDKYIKLYLPYNDDISIESLRFYFYIMFTLLENNLLDLDKLSSRDQNPLSIFLAECKERNYSNTKYGVFYIQQIVERGDKVIEDEIFRLCPGLGISEDIQPIASSYESEDDY